MSNLKIYKASAGSGKTFQITREYLKLIFQDQNAYRHILAVTFTNKATAEMKGRILSELHLLAGGKPSQHLDELTAITGKTEDAIRELANRILKSVLHDYSRFSVSTIDSFFQRVVRAFTREIRLHASFRTELDHRAILEEAVERLFLGIDENDLLREWFLDFAEETLQVGQNWNFKQNILERGSEIFGEAFRTFDDELITRMEDKEFLSDYGIKLRQIADKFDERMADIGRKAIAVMNRHGLNPESFKYGGRSFAFYFQKLIEGNFEPGARVLSAVDNPDDWTTKTADPAVRNAIAEAYDDGLNSLLKEALQYYHEESPRVESAKAILPNLYTLGVLTDLASKVKEISLEKNILILSDTAQLLNKVIAGSDTPFVYEKMGSVYQHFMLDEFQDTSRMQWHNLNPLVENSLAEGGQNMVVGDVKQSIYRWRNGDWNLLANQLQNDFQHYGVDEVTLDTNWRSSRNVVDFNNIIFRQASEFIQDEVNVQLGTVNDSPDKRGEFEKLITRAYADHFQKCAKSEGEDGYVRIELMENEGNKDDFRQLAIAKTISDIEKMQELGYEPGDMAILVRNKREGAEIGRALLEKKLANPDTSHNYDVISNDSLFVGNAATVKFILNYFHILAGPKNKIREAEMIHEFFFYLLPSMPQHDQALLKNEGKPQLNLFGVSELNEEKASEWYFNFENDMPVLFRDWLDDAKSIALKNELRGLPLYNLAERLIREFRLNSISGEWPYLQAFLDILLDYTRTESADINSFIDWWESTGFSKTISVAEEQNAIRVLTIHKSKGLEFPIVFIPFCDWPVYPDPKHAPHLWCKPDTAPFNELALVPVKYKKNLTNSLFAEEYFTEMLYSAVDNLNLLYVAFTRAKNALVVYGAYNAKLTKGVGNSMSGVLQRIFENPPLLDSEDRQHYIDVADFWDMESRIFQLGNLQSSVRERMPADTLMLSGFQLGGKGDSLKIRLHSQDYFEITPSNKLEKVNYGQLMHELFENIITTSDIDKALNRMLFEGKIEQAEKEKLKDEITEKLKDETVRPWFDGSWKVLAERDILRGKERTHRPDRVMMKDNQLVVVDYKTGSENEKNRKQVAGYLVDIRQMGFSNAIGYVWYIHDNKLVEVG